MILRYCSNLSSSCCSLLWNTINDEKNTPLYLHFFISFFSMLKNPTLFRHFLCKSCSISLSFITQFFAIQDPSVTDTREMSKAKRPRQSADFNPPLLRNYTPQCTGVVEEEMHFAGTFSWAYCVDKSSWVQIWLPRPLGHPKSSKYSLAWVLGGWYRKWFSGPNLVREVLLSHPFHNAS